MQPKLKPLGCGEIKCQPLINYYTPQRSALMLLLLLSRFSRVRLCAIP